MPKKPPPDPKSLALRQQGCWNPHPEQVTDELFQTREFFDPRDLVQVKYEMLRRVEAEGLPVNRSAAAFGFSRPSFYQAQASFQQGGLPALLPQSDSLHTLLWDAHFYLAFAFFALILLHVAAALFHALVRRDGVFEAMAPVPVSAPREVVASK